MGILTEVMVNGCPALRFVTAVHLLETNSTFARPSTGILHAQIVSHQDMCRLPNRNRCILAIQGTLLCHLDYFHRPQSAYSTDIRPHYLGHGHCKILITSILHGVHTRHRRAHIIPRRMLKTRALNRLPVRSNHIPVIISQRMRMQEEASPAMTSTHLSHTG
jgi:hypothetical protein